MMLDSCITHTPLRAFLAAVLVSPIGFSVIVLVVERRLVSPRTDFLALLVGDPMLGIALGALVWLGRARRVGTENHAVGIAFAALATTIAVYQWRQEYTLRFYSARQATSPSKIYHQLVIYPVLAYWFGASASRGLLPAPSIERTAVALCILLVGAASWVALLIYDNSHPKLAHVPFDWTHLRPLPRPWLATSVSLRASLSDGQSRETSSMGLAEDAGVSLDGFSTNGLDGWRRQ